MSIMPDSRHLLTLQKNTIFVSVNEKSIVGNPINMNRKAAYWLEMCDYDLGTAQAMFDAGRIPWSLSILKPVILRIRIGLSTALPLNIAKV